MRLDASTHARISLIALLGVILACLGLGGLDGQRRPTTARRRDLDPRLLDLTARQLNRADAGILAFLDTLLRRTPSAADYKSVLGHLDHPNWHVAGLAHEVLKRHGHAELATVRLRLLERALAEAHSSADPLDCLHQDQARLTILHELLDCLDPSSVHKCRALLVQVMERGTDGIARARAMELLASQPRGGLRRFLLAALDDPSERVRLVALDIISKHRWPGAAVGIESLASSPRPALRRRAAEVLEQFGRRVDPVEYGDSVLGAAAELANQLQKAGMELRDVIPVAGDQEDEQLLIELLHRRAEDYLDRSAVTNSGRVDSQGVLLLAAAAQAGQRKLSLRLWEHEISRADTDEDLRDRGIESLARHRILAGLAAYQRGYQSEGLRKLTSVAQIAAAASPSSSIQVYVRQAGALSAAIWQNTIEQVTPNRPIDLSPSLDPVARLAARLLDRLDVNDPDHRTEAHRRIDDWCGLAPPAEPAAVHRSMLAN